MKELIFLMAALIVLSCCVSNEKTVDVSGNTTCDGNVCNVNGSQETPDFKHPSTVTTDERTANEKLTDELNEELRKARANKTTPTNAITTTTVKMPGESDRFGGGYDHVEIIHFHGNAQCSSCIAVGAYAEETVNAYFAGELNAGRIVFGHVNYDLPENRALAEKYRVTGSSLMIGVYKKGMFYPEQNTDVWYKTNDKAAYMSYLKGVIEEKLAM